MNTFYSKNSKIEKNKKELKKSSSKNNN